MKKAKSKAKKLMDKGMSAEAVRRKLSPEKEYLTVEEEHKRLIAAIDKMGYYDMDTIVISKSCNRYNIITDRIYMTIDGRLKEDK